jgi:hypothetical protein
VREQPKPKTGSARARLFASLVKSRRESNLRALVGGFAVCFPAHTSRERQEHHRSPAGKPLASDDDCSPARCFFDNPRTRPNARTIWPPGPTPRGRSPASGGFKFFHPRGADLTCAPRAYRDGVPLNATSNSDIDLASSSVPAAGRFTSLPSSARPEPTHKLLTGKRESGRSTPHSCCEVETREKHRGQQRSKSCAADTTLASLREVVNKPVHAKA